MPSPGLHPDRSLGWIRRILPVFAQQRRVFAAAVAAGLAAVAGTVAVPIVIGRGVDAAAEGAALRPWVLTLAALAAIRFALGFAYRYGLFRSAHRLDADLRNLVYERLTELSFSYWDRTQTGQVISRANSDIRSIQLLFAFAPLMATQMVMLVMGTAAMVVLSLPLTLVAMAPLPLVLYVGIRLRNRVFPLSWVTQARMADLATIVDENIQGAQIVRTFAQEHNQVRTLARAAGRLCWAGTATADARARHAPIMEALPRLGLALVLLTGGLLAIDGRVAVGEIVAFNAYVLIMAAPFRMIGFVMIQWQRASAAAQRVFEILDETPEITERPGAVPLVQPAGRVELDDVTFSYAIGSGTSVIDGFSLVVEPGETVAVVGRTGSGKSTIARLLPRFYDVDRGAVSIDGIDVRDLRLSDLRRAVTVVTDDPFLFATSIRDNVAFARPDADEMSVAAAPRRCSRRGLRDRHALRDRRRARRAGLDHLRGPAPAAGHRPGAGGRPRGARARRRHQRDRQRGGRAHPLGAAPAALATHHHPDRPPPVDDRPGRQGRVPLRRKGGGHRQPPATAHHRARIRPRTHRHRRDRRGC